MLGKSIKNTLVQILGKAITVGISLVTTGTLTRKLGVSTYGGFILISSLFVLLDSLADFGTKTIGVREVAKDDRGDTWGEVWNIRWLTAGTAFCLGLMLVWWWPGLRTMRWEATVSMLMIFLTSVAGFLEIVFQVRLRMELKVIMDVVFPASFLLGVWWWPGNISLMWVMAGYLIARGVSLVVGWWLAAPLLNWRIDRKDGLRLPRKIWQMSWPMGLFLIVFAAYDRAIDSLLIQHFLGVDEVAWYGLAYKIYGVMLQPAYFFVNSIFPTISRQEEGHRDLLTKSLLILMAMAGVGIGVTWWGAPMMIYVLGGSDFWPAVMVLRTLMWAMIFSYIGHLLGFTLIAKGGQKEMMKLGMVALLVNGGLNVWLIPHYGILAAAGVTVITEAIDCGLMGWFLWKKVTSNKKQETRN